MSLFRGTGVALITPFKGGEIDFEALGQLLDFQINAGVEYIVALGTTGEAATLRKTEKIEVLQFCKTKIAGRVPLVVGVGSNDTAFVQREIKSMDLSGVAAILSVCPYYNKPTQEGIFQHYVALTEVTDTPIIIYNVPGRSGVNIEAATTVRLANHSKQFIGIKEASGSLEQCAKIQRDKPDGFIMITGNDELILPKMINGCEGVISVVANAYPKLFSDIIRLGLDKKYDEGNQLFRQLIDSIDYLFEEGNPVGVKTLIEVLFPNISSEVRLPLVKGSEELKVKLTAEYEKMKVSV